MPTQSLSQLRAKHALNAIEILAASARGSSGSGSSPLGHYVSYTKALPANIRSLGLGQAMAFLLAKAKGDTQDPHRLLYNHVAEWLYERGIYDAHKPVQLPDKFMTHLVNGTQTQYKQAQIEAMAYLEWLKKFAVALLTTEAKDLL